MKSLTKDKNKFIPVEVELTLWPGLPGIQFLGLPDQHIKESTLRIKSAIKSAGFQFPKAQQILVNLRPSHFKKTSRGLELAVACAYLLETGQVQVRNFSNELCVYGELSLQGDVLEPDDINDLPEGFVCLLTGDNRESEVRNFDRALIGHLKDLLKTPEQILKSSAQRNVPEPMRPQQALNLKFSKEQARLLSILALGEHPALLAGAAGAGKTTVAKSLATFLQAPSKEQFAQLTRIHQEFGSNLQWRPVVKPHHSTPIMAMIGGGAVPFAGEISRAHGGVLILDELLEFSSQVQESLREPFEERKMRVFRAGKLVEYPADVQIIATTNLCPCGDWTPKSRDIQCRYSRARCQSYSSKLSGPLVDRFEILFFHDGLNKLVVSGNEILEKVENARQFYLQQNKDEWKLEPVVSHMIDKENFSSQRRKNALLKVAKTIALLDKGDTINLSHYKEALDLCVHPFERLKRWC